MIGSEVFRIRRIDHHHHLQPIPVSEREMSVAILLSMENNCSLLAVMRSINTALTPPSFIGS